jgi:hypothetical protein
VRDLFGRSVVLAVYPRRDGKPEGVLLTKTAGEKSLADAIRLIERAEPGEVARTVKYLGVEYQGRSRRAKKGSGEKTLFYLRLDDVFVLSDRESMIRKVIRLSQRDAKASTAVKPLSGSRSYQAARESLRGDPVLTAYLNPREWDAVLKIPDGPGGQPPLPATLWKSCRWMMAGVRLDGGVVLDAVLDYDRAELPSLLRETLERLSGPPELLDRVPKTALLAFAGRIDPVGLVALVRARSQAGAWERGEAGKALAATRTTARALLRFDPVNDLLPRLKQGVVLYVVAREAGPAKGIPFHALFAVGLSAQAPGMEKWRERLETGLENALQFATNLHNIKAANAGGKQPARLAAVKSKTERGLRVHWIDNLAGFQPAFGLTPACLVFASDPELIHQFEAVEGPDRLVGDAAFQAWRRTFFADANQILFVNAELLRANLQRHREIVVTWRVKNDGVAEKDAARELDAAVQILGVVDAAFLTASIGRSRLRLTIGGVTRDSGNRKAEGGKRKADVIPPTSDL